MDFEIISEISTPETFAQGTGIREIGRLRKLYGNGHSTGVNVKVLLQ